VLSRRRCAYVCHTDGRAVSEYKGRPEDHRPASGKVARGYRWPTATAGNEIALKHGAYAPRRVDPLARELVETVADVAYLQDDPSYRTSLWAWGRAEARVQLVSEWIDQNGMLDEEGKPRPAADLLVRLEKQAADARARLGLDPLSRARLGRDVTASQFDLAQYWMLEDEREAAEQAAGGHQTPQDGPDGGEG